LLLRDSLTSTCLTNLAANPDAIVDEMPQVYCDRIT